MLKIVSIVGTRPQLVKASVVSRALKSARDIKEVMVHTGQHYDEKLSNVFFDELEIAPADHHLAVGSESHGAQTGRMLEGIEKVLMAEKPGMVLLYGDTNSTIAGALAAAKLVIPIAHIEAGLRSFRRSMPEEINRLLTDQISDILFVPTEPARHNLIREGIDEKRIVMVGDVMYDVALYTNEKAERSSTVISELGLIPKGYILVTVHRAENTDDPEILRKIFSGLKRTAEEYPVVLPLHPRTRAALERNGLLAEYGEALRLIEPVGYLDMAMLEKNALLIATDSGGVQKEAYFQHVPCVTLRDETEWVELVEGGFNVLVGSEAGEIAALARSFSKKELDYSTQLYGSGNASEKIVERLQLESG